MFGALLSCPPVMSEAFLGTGESWLFTFFPSFKVGWIAIVSIRVADPDPDSIGSVDPDSEPGSGFRRAKMTHKSRKKI